LLLQFIEPLLDGSEDKVDLLVKEMIGQIAWNHAVLKDVEIPKKLEVIIAAQKLAQLNPDLSRTFWELGIRKEKFFAEYKQFIFTVENRVQPNGTVNLRVISVPFDKLELTLGK
jgi:hypothetical protein